MTKHRASLKSLIENPTDAIEPWLALQTIDTEIDDDLFRKISLLRQLINEEFVHHGKQVSNQFIYDVLFKESNHGK